MPLRLHLAELPPDAGRGDEAVTEVSAALQRAPGDAQARQLMARAVGGAGTPAPTEPAPAAPAPDRAITAPADQPAPPAAESYDWRRAEGELADVLPPRFAEPPRRADGEDDPGDAGAWDVESDHAVRLADVGGMTEVKQRLEAAFLAPMRNPELRRLYGKSMHGGLLLHGPPGCGKTFIARAVAEESGAGFMSIGINDVLDMRIGNSERNLHELFETARRNAPCVLFLDELDALGAKRSQARHNGMRNAVNQLLTELDGVGSDANESVFVLAATNHPWDVDTALRRPGRTLLVLPPDESARDAILRCHLKDRPIAGVELSAIARRTDGYSGADLKYLCESAAERALMDSVASGTPRMIGTDDLLAHLRRAKGSAIGERRRTGPAGQGRRALADRPPPGDRRVVRPSPRRAARPRGRMARARLVPAHARRRQRRAPGPPTSLNAGPGDVATWLRRGEILLCCRQYLPAIQAAREATRLGPDDWRGYRLLADTLSGFADLLPQAHQVALRAVELAPQEAEAHFVLGRVCEDSRMLPAAEQTYRTTVNLQPDHAAARTRLGELSLLSPGWNDRGRLPAEHHAAALALDPHSTRARRDVERFTLGLLGRAGWRAVLSLLIGVCCPGFGTAARVGGLVAVTAVRARWARLMRTTLPERLRPWMVSLAWRSALVGATATGVAVGVLCALLVLVVPDAVVADIAFAAGMLSATIVPSAGVWLLRRRIATEDGHAR